MPEKPRPQHQLFTRRNALISLAGLGGAIVADRLGLFDIFDSRREAQVSEEETNAQKKSEPGVPEYEEWASKIELPEMKLDEGFLDWNRDRREKHLLSKKIDQDRMDRFMSEFNRLKNQIINELKNIKPSEMRTGYILLAFFKELAENFQSIIEAQQQDSKEDFSREIKICKDSLDEITRLSQGLASSDMHDKINDCIDEISRLLLSQNVYMNFDFNRTKKGIQIAFYEVEKARSVKVRLGDQDMELPVLFLSNLQSISSFPDLPPNDFPGMHVDPGNCIVLSINDEGVSRIQKTLKKIDKWCRKNGIKRAMPNTDQVRKDMTYEIIAHEGMHAALHHMLKIGSWEHSVIQPKGTIDMGRYKLRESEYYKTKDYYVKDGVYLHELIAGGYSLMNSGHVANYVAGGHIYKPSTWNHILAHRIFIRELAHSPFVNQESRRRIMEGEMDAQSLIGELLKISNEELHNIGERMAKLGLYLAQEK